MIASTPANLDPPDLVNAGFARRLIALVYEALIAVALTLVAATPFVMIAGEPSGSLTKMTFRLYLLLVIGAHFIFCWVKGGQTLPMKTWRLRLVSRDGGGVPLSLAVLRFVLALAGYGLGNFDCVGIVRLRASVPARSARKHRDRARPLSVEAIVSPLARS